MYTLIRTYHPTRNGSIVLARGHAPEIEILTLDPNTAERLSGCELFGDALSPHPNSILSPYRKLCASAARGTGVVATIQLAFETRERLARLKQSPRETYDELLNKVLDLVPTGDEEGADRAAFRVGLLDARLDIRASRTVRHEDLKRRLGL